MKTNQKRFPRAADKNGNGIEILSPFNKEKTASFFVNDQKAAWFDFSSGKNGSIFDFVMLTEGLSFPEAVERLATQAGMPLPQVSREDEARDQRRKSLIDIVELAAKFYISRLQRGCRCLRRCVLSMSHVSSCKQH